MAVFLSMQHCLYRLTMLAVLLSMWRVAAFTSWTPYPRFKALRADLQKLEEYLEYRKDDKQCIEAHAQPGHRFHAWECTRETEYMYHPGGINGGMKGTMPGQQFRYISWTRLNWNCTVCHESCEGRIRQVEHDILGCPGPRDP
jgi:hypothetical protein